MKKLIKTAALAAIATASMLASGCATQLRPASAFNPPPREPLSNFTAYELQKTQFVPLYPGARASSKVLASVDKNIAKNTGVIVRDWNMKSKPSADAPARTLVITPEVTGSRHINMALRIFFGPIPGNSALQMRLKLTEKETGDVIAHPVFFRNVNAFVGGFTLGILDSAIIGMATARSRSYLLDNYNKAVGSPTGLH